MFRIPRAQALVNRLGFNNDGVTALLANLERARYQGVLGINIGKNFDTPNERAADDYVACLRAVYPKAHYVTVNISSPNTKGLRDLQSEDALAALLVTLKREQATLADRHGRYVPLAIKIAPDLTDDAVRGVARVLLEQAHGCGDRHQHDALARRRARACRTPSEAGGLSGAPRIRALDRSGARARAGARRRAADHRRRRHRQRATGARQARRRARARAALHGLIYRGPALVGECVATRCAVAP